MNSDTSHPQCILPKNYCKMNDIETNLEQRTSIKQANFLCPFQNKDRYMKLASGLH